MVKRKEFVSKHAELDATLGGGLSTKARQFLAQIDEWIYGSSHPQMPVLPEGSQFVKEVVLGLSFRIITERGSRKAELFKRQWQRQNAAASKAKKAVRKHAEIAKQLKIYMERVGITKAVGKLVKDGLCSRQTAFNIANEHGLTKRSST